MNYSIPYGPFSNSVVFSSTLITSAYEGLALLDSNKCLRCVPVLLWCHPMVLHEWGLGLGFCFLSANWVWKQDTGDFGETDCLLVTSGHSHICMWQKMCVTVRPTPARVGLGVFHQCPTNTASQGCKVPVCGYLDTVLWCFHSPFPKAYNVGVFFACCVLISDLYVLVLKYFVVTGLWWCALGLSAAWIVHIPGWRTLVGLASLLTRGIIKLHSWSTVCFVGFFSACISKTRLAGLLIFSVALSVLSFSFIALTWVVVVVTSFFHSSLIFYFKYCFSCFLT